MQSPFEFHRVSQVMQGSGNRAFGYFRTARQQPSWVTRAATITFLIVIGVPILLVLVAAVVLALLVFFVLGLVAAVIAWFRGLVDPSSRKDAGRENVRVIQRRDD